MEQRSSKRPWTRFPMRSFPFFELPITADPRGLLAALVGSDAGAKVRTGGVAADLYPDPGHLARFIAACAAARVPFKATAGLHHPLRHFSQAVQAHEFGFLNVFVAAALSMHGEFDTSQLLSVLTDERIESFGFDDEGIAWRGEMVTVDQLERSRELLAISFGSCSFDEPRADLRSLHLL